MTKIQNQFNYLNFKNCNLFEICNFGFWIFLNVFSKTNF